MKIAGKVCLVTGGARRVGRIIALELARRGGQVVVHCNSSEREARETAEECSELSGHQASVVRADQSDPRSIQRCVEELGRVDILINNASIFHSTPFHDLTLEQWDEMQHVNLRGPAWWCRCVACGMKKKGGGVIINITDAHAGQPDPGYVPYGVAKAGLLALTRGLALELAPEIRVNAVAPGPVLMPKNAPEDLAERCAATTALGRLGTPEDVAAACVFLIEGSDYVTGACLPVDGGTLPTSP